MGGGHLPAPLRDQQAMLKRMEKDFEEAKMDDFQETVSTRHSRTARHMNSFRLWQQAQGLLHMSKPGGLPTLRGGRRSGFPSLTKKLSESNNKLQRKNLFSSMKPHWVY